MCLLSISSSYPNHDRRHRLFTREMAGSKRHRIKKALSPNSTSSISPPTDTTDDDEDLLDDLVAQLDAKDGNVQQAAATMIQEVEKKTDEQAKTKKDGRSRFQARKVCNHIEIRLASVMTRRTLQGS